MRGMRYQEVISLQNKEKVPWFLFFVKVKAEVFYDVNYVNVNYSVKNSTVDCNIYFFSKTVQKMPI